MEEVRCPECNALLEEADLEEGFCPYCGAELDELIENLGATWIFQNAGVPIWG